jgi:hypothetical protein
LRPISGALTALRRVVARRAGGRGRLIDARPAAAKRDAGAIRRARLLRGMRN